MFGTDFGEKAAVAVKAILLAFIVCCTFVYTKGLNDKEVFELTNVLNQTKNALELKEKEIERLKEDIKMLDDIKKIQQENIEELKKQEVIIITEKETRKSDAQKKRDNIDKDTSKTDQQKDIAKQEVDYDFMFSSFCSVNVKDPACKQ